jgi:eukaryotic-like serine/threonine-protein kinase
VNAIGAGPAIGYIAHLPPEALIGPGEITDAAGDIFAMGVTLYRLLEGDAQLAEMRSKGVDISQQIIAGKFPPNIFSSHVHDRLRRVVRKATRSDPRDRYTSATKMRHALEAARPVVSWKIANNMPTEVIWEGVHIHDEIEYRACIQQDADGAWLFWIEKRLPGKDSRRQRNLGKEAMMRSEILRHAYSVLGGLAQPS